MNVNKQLVTSIALAAVVAAVVVYASNNVRAVRRAIG